MKEQRKSPRISKNFSVKFSDADFDVLTETSNISASGAYCPVTKPLDPMTKFSLLILLPFKKNKTVKKISCTGVIVRCESTNDDSKYPYRVGIYFSDLKDKDRKTLGTYINTFLNN